MAGQASSRNRRWLFYLAITFAGLLLFAIPVGSVLLFETLLDVQKLPEIVLPALLIEGVVVLLGTIGLITIAYKRFQLTNPAAPLGLPEGSVRAIIAMLLILIFAVMALFLYASLLRGERVTRTLTQEQILELPPETQIVTRTEVTDDTFVVELRLPATPESSDLAKQIVTTVSTLVVAIAAFYFGTQATQTAAAAVSGQNGAPALQINTPASPSALPGKGESVRISLTATPSGEKIRSQILSGDPAGTITEQTSTEFDYVVGEPSGDLVVLKFSLERYPGVAAYLELQAQR